MLWQIIVHSANHNVAVALQKRHASFPVQLEWLWMEILALVLLDSNSRINVWLLALISLDFHMQMLAMSNALMKEELFLSNSMLWCQILILLLRLLKRSEFITRNLPSKCEFFKGCTIIFTNFEIWLFHFKFSFRIQIKMVNIYVTTYSILFTSNLQN